MGTLLKPRTVILTTLLGIVSSTYSPILHAEIRPERIHVADNKKTKAYIREGLFIGGDRAINDVTVKGIRFAPNSEFERIVIDLEGNRNGETVAIPRPPYFQFAALPEEKKLVFTIWGQPKLKFDPKKTIAGFKKSKLIRNVVFLPPRLEENLWTLVLELKSDTPIEVFELNQPVRVILDIKRKKG